MFTPCPVHSWIEWPSTLKHKSADPDSPAHLLLATLQHPQGTKEL